jgi:hypothetical protein
MAIRMWALVAAWAVFLWWVGWRLSRRSVTVSLVVLSLVTFTFLSWQSYLEYNWQHNEALYAKAIEPITGKGKDVHCQRLLATWVFAGAELGHVQYNADGSISPEAWMTYETCHHLGQWMASDKSHPNIDEVMAVHVLSHEAQHLAGVKSEANAECRAMQQDALVARRLGATKVQARELQLEYYTKVYPHMADEYRAAACAIT